jgi:hypothetical protein
VVPSNKADIIVAVTVNTTLTVDGGTSNVVKLEIK